VLRQRFQTSTFHQALVDGERLVHIADTATIEWGAGTEEFRVAVETSDARTVLLVPLRKDGISLGLIAAGRPEVRPFSDKQIALLQNFAGQAVIAIENARLLGELRARTAELVRSVEELQLLSEVGQAGAVFRYRPPCPCLRRSHDHRRELQTRRRTSRPALPASRGRDRNAMTPITVSSQLLPAGEPCLRHCTACQATPPKPHPTPSIRPKSPLRPPPRRRSWDRDRQSDANSVGQRIPHASRPPPGKSP
jgi:hypothetical protein